MECSIEYSLNTAGIIDIIKIVLLARR